MKAKPKPGGGPRLTAVLTIRNRPGYLLECCASILGQDFSHRRFEVVLVDDASDHEFMAEALKNCLKAFDRVGIEARLIRNKERLGPGESRNRGNDEARGEIIAVCDSDDFNLPGRFREIAAWFKVHPDKKVFYSGAYRVNQDLDGRVYHAASISHVALLDHHQEIWHPTTAYRAEIAKGRDAPARYPAELADVDFGFLRRAKAAFPSGFGCLDRPLVLYRTHEEQISHSQARLQHDLMRLKIGKPPRSSLNYVHKEPGADRHLSHYERRKLKRKGMIP